MSTRIYATSGDTNRVITATLYDDNVVRDLTTATAIQCHLRERSAGTVTVITGLTGSAAGVVDTTIATLAEGTFTVEWEVTEGSQVTTYPGNAADRPLLIVRAEAD